MIKDRVWGRVRKILKKVREEDNGDFWTDRILSIPEIKRGLELYEKEEKEADKEKVQEIFEEIERSWGVRTYQGTTVHLDYIREITATGWQALKERMLK